MAGLTMTMSAPSATSCGDLGQRLAPVARVLLVGPAVAARRRW